jgi:hypothetical protein
MRPLHLTLDGRPSPLTMHSFGMQHQVIWCAPLAAIDSLPPAGSRDPASKTGRDMSLPAPPPSHAECCHTTPTPWCYKYFFFHFLPPQVPGTRPARLVGT